jgi:opacity protein-like surface antigen
VAQSSQPWSKLKARLPCRGTKCGVGHVPAGIDVTETKTRGGWTAGVGAEFAMWSNWTWKVEYLHVGFGHDSYFDAAPFGVTPRTGVPLTDDIIRFGLNYRFGGVTY